jgi:hypothetical protein
LLSSCSLVGLYVNLQVKVTEKFDENFQSIFRVGFLKLKLRFAEKGKVKITVGNKMIAGVGLEPNHVWASCWKTWLKFEIKAFHCRKKKS